ncbi:MAG: dephospho-CoA kinase [SAR324 cluster bacterium]|nr:dephospho-CoA kinase [SAR324 cluster bacterium]
MRIVGITGSIGSGKSTLADLLKVDHFCIDADDLAREAVAKGSKGLSQITQAFGAQILTPDYELDRKKIAAIVFNDKAKLATLNAIVHPEVHRLRALAFDAAYQTGSKKFIFYIVPLLFENQMEKYFQKVILLTIDPEVQIQRLTEKRGFTAEEAAARIANQMPQSEKITKADIIINNDGGIISLTKQLNEVMESVLSKLPQLGPEAFVFS